ncbi:hypothetical protein K1719_016552 [Acacia pycnantha]|nr:hypothetical protein K1719_040881 [Acacia pycnantha]KAI9112355.1 hypothetical protein K1719_016552 [Acacia pycnantha]
MPISVLGTSYPPSLSVFLDESKEAMSGFLGFLAAQAIPTLVNMYPYFAYSFFWAMEKVGIADVDVVVSESGWPSDGNGELTTVSMAATYNQNFVRRIVSQAGTPKRHDLFIEGFVFAMFNANLKPAGVEQHYFNLDCSILTRDLFIHFFLVPH